MMVAATTGGQGSTGAIRGCSGRLIQAPDQGQEPSAPGDGAIAARPRKSIHRQQVEHNNWNEADDYGKNVLGDTKLPACHVVSIGSLMITHGVPHCFLRGTSNEPHIIKDGAAR
jgi:hypothetical protein